MSVCSQTGHHCCTFFP
jgi:hypothetical protein